MGVPILGDTDECLFWGHLMVSVVERLSLFGVFHLSTSLCMWQALQSLVDYDEDSDEETSNSDPAEDGKEEDSRNPVKRQKLS